MTTATQSSKEFEIVDFTPNRRRQDQQVFLDMLEVMLTVPPGKSIRKGFSNLTEAKKFDANARTFLKRRQLTKTFFIRCYREADADGKFYVYIGRKAGE